MKKAIILILTLSVATVTVWQLSTVSSVSSSFESTSLTQLANHQLNSPDDFTELENIDNSKEIENKNNVETDDTNFDKLNIEQEVQNTKNSSNDTTLNNTDEASTTLNQNYVQSNEEKTDNPDLVDSKESPDSNPFEVDAKDLFKQQNVYKQELTNKKNIILIDKSTNSACAHVIEYFYEDANYRYYFTCKKSQDMYVIVNNKEYLLVDALKNKIVTMAELEKNGYHFPKEVKLTK